jgi:hypothetical protein
MGASKVPKTLSKVFPGPAHLRILTQDPRHLPKTLDDFDGCLGIAIE